MKFKRLTAIILVTLALIISLCSCDLDLGSSSGGGGGGFDVGGDAPSGGGAAAGGDVSAQKGDKVITEGDLQIHFIELGNKYTGDCTYIRAGENDILIDAGSKASSVETIDKYLRNYVKDKTLEYVIVTHAHEDHYAGFATSEKKDSLFDLYECKTIIDFAQVEKGKEEKTQYKNYIRERDAEIAEGAVHYTAAEAVQDESIKGKFDLGSGITMTVLDSYFYYNRSTSENNHSVCTLFSDGTNNYLLTGDLEEEGEEKLIEMNELPRVKLYKAAHHGSKTSSSDALLKVIQPEIVTVCCCCGSPQYTDIAENQFPTQQFINRISPYTDAVYVTTICVNYKAEKAEDAFKSMNGNIIIISEDGKVSVVCTANSDKLKNTKWFKENRTVPPAWAS